MYSKDFWNNIYKVHITDAPWMSEACANNQLEFMEQYLGDVKGKRFLDYGCGNGQVAYHFHKKGAKLVLADISDDLIEWLKQQYNNESITIIQAATPQDIPDDEGLYDIITANCLFHHIQPELWTSFLKGFAELMKPDALLIISGWDETDEIIEKEKIAAFTHYPAWPITSLRKNIDKTNKFDVLADYLKLMELPGYFNISRKFRYYTLKRR